MRTFASMVLLLLCACRAKPEGQQSVEAKSQQGTLKLELKAAAQVRGSVSHEKLLELPVVLDVTGPADATVHLIAQERCLEGGVGCSLLQAFSPDLALGPSGHATETRTLGFGNRKGCELEVVARLDGPATGDPETAKAVITISAQ